MSTMKEQLVNEAIGLVRVRGYSAFSYADLADAVGIRKPSIHHHFPTKEDLGQAIVQSYSEEFFTRLQAISERRETVRDKIEAYTGRR
jgi:TetR/AcrR family transcriptional repressor of nem operon